MFTFKRYMPAWLLLPVLCWAQPSGPALGKPASAKEIAAWDIDIAPDGQNLPAGQGTVANGEQLYKKLCASCHGAGARGGSAEELAGSETPLDSEWPDKTIGTYWPYATTLFDFLRRSMPPQAPGSLSNDQTYALTAYLLYLNNIIAKNETLDAERLADIVMPNRDGFIRYYPDPR